MLSLTNSKKTEIYSKLSIGGDVKIGFSPNDSLIYLDFTKGKITIINLFTKSQLEISGNKLSWLNSHSFFYTNFGSIFLYDINVKKSFLFINNSEKFIKYNYNR